MTYTPKDNCISQEFSALWDPYNFDLALLPNEGRLHRLKQNLRAQFPDITQDEINIVQKRYLDALRDDLQQTWGYLSQNDIKGLMKCCASIQSHGYISPDGVIIKDPPEYLIPKLWSRSKDEPSL